LSLSPEVIGSETTPHLSQKTLQHIYVGIDIWGRGSHGGGGFGASRALEHISPDCLGLSAAIFGQAWTWESEQDKDEWSWDKWWDYDSSLWVGPASDLSGIPLPEMEWKKGEEHCKHDRFMPITSFFPRHSPPDPADIQFHTTFCPGTGLGWFVEGRKVFESRNGWTDVDKQTSIGDMLWPRPTLYWEDEREDNIPTASVNFHMDDAWNAGNSLCVTISCPGSDDELAAYRPLWLPVQSLCITPRKVYRASVVYKVSMLADGTETEFALSLRKPPGSQDEDIVCSVTSSSEQDLSNGWTKLIIEFNISPHANFVDAPMTVCIGLIVAVVTVSPVEPVQISILLGELNVSPLLPPSYTQDEALILWADYRRNSIEPRAPQDNPSFSGTLSWEIASTFPAVDLRITSPEDPLPAWNCQPTIPWFPSFLYFNIYTQPFSDEYTVGKVDEAIWIGTSGAGWSGKRKAFTILQENLPFEVPAAKVRFYVQGVSDCGEVMKWSRCAFVDVSLL
jgi:mannosyl-glycoprotein endo-beta-N-acetylglucosaminidase